MPVTGTYNPMTGIPSRVIVGGVPIPIGDEPKVFTSSPWDNNQIGNFTNFSENIMFYVLLLKLSQTPQGLAIVKSLMEKLVEGTMDALGNLARAGVANRITAYSSGRLISLVLERFGMITQAQAIDYSISLNLITGAQAATDWIGLLPWTVIKEDSTYPDSVNLGETIKTTTFGIGPVPRSERAISKSPKMKEPKEQI